MTKQQQRAAGKAARQALGRAQRAQASRAICEAIAACDAFRAARTVLLYRAVGSEADLADLAALAGGRVLAWPCCVLRGQMEAYVPAAPQGWKKDRYGILAPDPACAGYIDPAEIDLVLVPGTAFDRAGGRVGMGAGIYDRYLPRCTHAFRIGVAFEAQLVPQADVGPQDVRMHALATEAGVRPAAGRQ